MILSEEPVLTAQDRSCVIRCFHYIFKCMLNGRYCPSGYSGPVFRNSRLVRKTEKRRILWNMNSPLFASFRKAFNDPDAFLFLTAGQPE